MNITKVQIRKITPKEGLVGFASFVIEDSLYIGNVGVFSRLNKDNFRLIFPEKKVNDKKIPIFYPLTTDFYYTLENMVNEKIKEID